MFTMTKKFPCLIQEFIVPALDNNTYGDNLKWVDKEEGIFCLSWNHKNAAPWVIGDSAVFVDWDKLKGHYSPQEVGYFMKVKLRFHLALYKLEIVEELPCKQKNRRLYKLHLDEDRCKQSNCQHIRKPQGSETDFLCSPICSESSASETEE